MIDEKQVIEDRKLVNQQNQNYTDKEAAKFLRISGVSLWRARKKGLITFRRVMGRIIYTESDLQDFLTRSKRGGFCD